MQSLPLLSKPLEGEILYMYLSVSDEAVSFVLVRLEIGGQQKSVYYTSKILHEVKIRYPKMQKLIYSIIVAAKRLRPYFQAHPIVVLTDQPLKAIP